MSYLKRYKKDEPQKFGWWTKPEVTNVFLIRAHNEKGIHHRHYLMVIPHEDDTITVCTTTHTYDPEGKELRKTHDHNPIVIAKDQLLKVLGVKK